MSKSFGIHVIEYPTGRFGFAGNVPAELTFEYDGPLAFDEAVAAAKVSGPGFVKGLKRRAFDTREDAETALREYQS